MFSSFCKTHLTRGIAIFSAIILLVFSGLLTQLAILVIAAFIGVKYLVNQELVETGEKFTLSWLPLILFAVLLLLLPFLANVANEWKIANEFYQAGSMVFGGGHVVLPLLQNLLAEQLPTDTFLTGYAAAQAVPGPMFTLATFLGFHLSTDHPILGAMIATVMIFLPSFLLMLTFLKHWQSIASMPKLAGAMQAVNAAVVGLLLSALYMPVFNAAVINTIDMALVILGFYLLKQVKVPIVTLVAGFAATGALLTLL